MSACFIDLFPVELLRTIFEYLWAHEIFHSFFNISDYVDNVLLSYDQYYLNFQSVLKNDFELVCHHVQPHQVISLTLSDSDDTPGQSQLFLSFFSMNQFSRLRAIKLVRIDDESRSLFSDLHKLETLISLELELKFYPLCQDMASQVKRLILDDTTGSYFDVQKAIFNTSTFSHLHHLTIPYCSCGQLRQILYRIPTLRVLKASTAVSSFVDTNEFTDMYRDSLFNLNCLILSINTSISRIVLERFLSHLPHLKELELVCLDGDYNLGFASHWEKFLINYLPSISIFNFKFKLNRISLPGDIIVAPFRTSFWINEIRHWYVAYDHDKSLLFTVPRFAPQAIVHPHFPVLSNSTTVPIERHMTVYDRITELTLDSENESLFQFQYSQVKMLTLLSFNIDKKIIDLCKVQHLSMQIPQQWSLQELIRFINESMPCLHTLNLDSAFSVKSSTPVVPLTQVRTLYLSYFTFLLKNYDIDLSRFFPRVERLTATVSTRRQMALLIDQFKHLSSGSFYVVNCQMGVKNDLREPRVTREWLINNTQHLRQKSNNSFTCRFDRQRLFWLHLWISNHGEYQNKESEISLNDDEEETNNDRWRHNCLPRCSLI